MATFGDVSSNGLSNNQFKNIVDGLEKIGITDARNAATKMNNAIKRASTSGSSSSTIETSAGMLKNTILAGIGALYDRYENESFRVSAERINSIVKAITDATGGTLVTRFASGVWTALTDIAKNIGQTSEEINDKIIKMINQNSMFAGELASTMREEMRDTLPLAQMMGVSTEDFLSGAESLFKAQGRMISYSQETLQYAVTVGKAYTENATDIMANIDNFRNVSLGLADASKNIERIGKSSAALGLNAKETTKTVMSNLDKMNQYGFKNGIEGLSRMVMQSQALKINMDNVFKIADKVFDPEGAIELTAGLQAIGGAFGDLADPMRAMYDATNNVEGLQDAFIKAASSLSVYNAEQGRFEVTGANLRRAKAMADLYGISLNEVTNAATKGAAKLEAMSQMQMFGNLSPQQQEFVSNLSQMKGGKIGIEIPKSMMSELGMKESFVELSNLSAAQIEKLQKYQEDIAGMSTEDIALEQMNTTTKIANILTSIQRGLENRFFKSDTAKATRDVYSGIESTFRTYGPGKENDAIKTFGGMVDNLINSASGMVPDTFKTQLGDLLKDLRENLPSSPKNRSIPNDMIVPNPIYGRETSKVTRGRYDVYFHATSNLVTPFLTAIERDSELRKNFSETLQNPSYLDGPEVMA